MDSIDKWLKSLRLHKYTPLFKPLTYEQMLNINEKQLIDLDITKGARNKILVSVKRLNQRQDKLITMTDDLDQRNISMKEALNILKDMLITPIPHSNEENRSKLTASCSPSSISSLTSESAFVTSPSSMATSSGGSSSASSGSYSDEDDDNNARYSINSSNASPTSDFMTTPSTISTSMTPSTIEVSSAKTTNSLYRRTLEQTPMPNIASYFSKAATNNTPTTQIILQQQYLDPHDLTYLFVDTFEQLAKRLIESAGLEDSACHGILVDIVDECLKHNSFTNEQKALMARYRQRILLEQKAKPARNKHLQQQQNQQQQQYQQHQQQYQHHLMREQKARSVGFKQQAYQGSRLQNSYHLHSRLANTYDHHYYDPHMLQQHQQNQYHYQQQNHQHQYQSFAASNHQHHYQSNQFHHQEHQKHKHTLLTPPKPVANVTYGEYSLLGPGKTFELPCLRAAVAERSSRKS